ncbi:hypothetical protein P691DRAFT_799526 [Macrolepiota fuliginosa MF-IS2]|uniref:Uncharacterized protein n=1 Tax=Macrolepiota fuliginosa MF-IS2 TaxID=1400762 RepID=A0A9P5XGN7_9AGAR|nr:hypothetical protein P691DRAFT_799526 [Macrolepiota fuliginosa MF-IS2]
MAQTFLIDAAQVVGLFMESVFYGCLRVLFMMDGRLKPFARIHLKMVFAAVAMFVFASLDVAFHLRHNLEAFTVYEGDPVEEFSKVSNWINVVSMGCYVGQTFIGDSILLYRCWIIWSRKWWIVLAPAIFWLAGTTCGILTIYTEATLRNSDGLLNASKLIPFITSMLSLTLVTNLLTTSLMVYRIQTIRKRLKHKSNSTTYTPLTNVMRLLIESGLLYTSSIVILFILYMSSNNGQYGVSDAIVQIIGITFNLIITRVDRGEATQPASQNIQTGTTVPLHTISIQTTVSRFADPVDPPKLAIPDDLESQRDADSQQDAWKQY